MSLTDNEDGNISWKIQITMTQICASLCKHPWLGLFFVLSRSGKEVKFKFDLVDSYEQDTNNALILSA